MALAADEGLTPTPVHVTTGSGTLSMKMMAITMYDTTVAGTPSDSGVLAVAWTSNYQQYVALSYFIETGVGVPARRIAATARLAGLASLTGRAAACTPNDSLFVPMPAFGFVVDGNCTVQADNGTDDIRGRARAVAAPGSMS